MKTVQKYKNIILLALLFFIFNCTACLAAQNEGSFQEQIAKIEVSLWDLNYPNDTDDVRIKRIENEVFGSSNEQLNLQERINKLNSALGLESLAESKAPASELYKDEVAGVSYPAVDMLEQQLFQKNYKSENIYKRLERLENKVFGKTQTGDLAQRTDSLKARISMVRPSSSLPGYQTGEYYAPQSGNGPLVFGEETLSEDDVVAKARSDAKNRSRTQNRGNYADYDYGYGGSDTALQIAGLENSLFGQTYSYDPMTLRLNRLERRIFQRDFASDDEYERIQRLQAAATAKKTAKYYDGNKFQKFASTGMQLGTFVLMILALIL